MKNDKIIYEGPIFTLHQFEVEINGKTYKRDVLNHHGAVGVIVKKDNKFLLVKQMRYGIMKETLEIPAGLIDVGESKETAAIRELEEETGLKPLNLEYLYELYSVPAYCNEVLHLFYADKFITSKKPLDEDEDLEVIWMNEDEIRNELKKQSTQFDMKTVIAFQYYLLNKKDSNQ